MRHKTGDVLNGRRLVRRVGTKRKDVLWSWRCNRGHKGIARPSTLLKTTACPQCQAVSPFMHARPVKAGQRLGAYVLVDLATPHSKHHQIWLAECVRCHRRTTRRIRELAASRAQSCVHCAGKLIICGELLTLEEAAALFGVPAPTILQRRLTQKLDDATAAMLPVLGNRAARGAAVLATLQRAGELTAIELRRELKLNGARCRTLLERLVQAGAVRHTKRRGRYYYAAVAGRGAAIAVEQGLDT